jgi:predicted AAA+ superfamily ATPase
MVVEEQPSWGPHLRSRDLVRQSPLRHFADPSLAAATLGAGPDRLLRDLNTLGLLFESMAIRDLRVYSQALGGTVSHYRDSSGLEADAVITLRDGRWAVVEVKLAASQADAAARTLDRLVAKLDLSRIGPPAARMVITAGEYAYTRNDGVIVAPLACLGP